MRIFIGEMSPKNRERVREVLESTRVFRSAEIDVAIELFDTAFGSVANAAVGADTAPHEKIVTPPASSDYFFLGAFTPEEELAGFACYGPMHGADRTYDLYWIAVDPAVQGSGCGTILLNEVERRLKGLNARMVVVETSSRSDYGSSRGFYIQRGYVEAARSRDFYAPADDRITYTKRLQSSVPSFGWMAHGAMSQ